MLKRNAKAESRKRKAGGCRRIITGRCLLFALLTMPTAVFGGDNFRVVNLPPSQAAVYDRAAEEAYTRLSSWWFGQPHPDLWRPTTGPFADRPPVPMTIQLRQNQFGGSTTFRINRGEVFGWRMTLTGSRERLLADVIPHEVGHVVFYAKFHRPLGRMLDEGAATIGESSRQHAEYRRDTAEAIRRRHVIPLQTALDETRYPSDGNTLRRMYAQAHSLVEFLLQWKGRPTFLAFLNDRRKPTEKLRDFYSCGPAELQTRWQSWFLDRAERGLDCRSFGCPYHAAKKPTQPPTSAGAKRLPVIYAFTADWCRACRPFKRDVAAGRFPGYRFVFVDPEKDREQWKRITAKMLAETHHRGDVPLPSWWLPGTKRLVVMQNGYSAAGLLQILGRLIRGVIRLIHNPEHHPTGTIPQGKQTFGEGAPVPSDGHDTAASTEDWTGVTISLLVAEQDVGPVRGRARSALIGLSRGPLQRKARELTGGKASLAVVAERIQPTRYHATLSAAGLEPARLDVIVLVPRTARGLVKGLIVGKIQRLIEEKLSSRPHIDVIFERQHPADFAAVHAALRTTEADQTLRRKEINGAVAAKLTGEPAPESQNDLKLQIVFWLASLGLPLWLLERVTKSYRLAKLVERKWRQLHSSSAPSSRSSESAEPQASSSAASPNSASESN